MQNSEINRYHDSSDMENYEVSYTAKDLILYALSLGMGSHSDDTNELKFLYEAHQKFTGVPTFCFAFTFWAKNQRNPIDVGTTTQRIPSFPPPIMSENEIIPREFLRHSIDISSCPVIHTWQSIVWHHPMEIPTRQAKNGTVKFTLNQTNISIQPKSIGTFVTSQSKVTSEKTGQLSCSMQSTALVLGVDPKNIIANDTGVPRQTCIRKTYKKKIGNETRSFQWVYQTSRSQALLYRMASGDSNHIHVDTSASEMLGNKRKAPLLHGLFTLALAFRAVVKLFNRDNSFDENDCELFFRRLEGAFRTPAFVGDCLCVKIWNHDTAVTKSKNRLKSFLFVIVDNSTGAVVVDNGYAEVEIVPRSLTSRL